MSTRFCIIASGPGDSPRNIISLSFIITVVIFICSSCSVTLHPLHRSVVHRRSPRGDHHHWHIKRYKSSSVIIVSQSHYRHYCCGLFFGEVGYCRSSNKTTLPLMMWLDLDLNLCRRYTVSVNNDFDDNNNKTWTKVLVSLIVFPFIVTSIECFFFFFFLSSYVIKVMCAVHTFEKRPRVWRFPHQPRTQNKNPLPCTD